MFCKYTGCASNSSARYCRISLTPDKCEFGRVQKRIEVAYQKGIEYGRRNMTNRIMKILLPAVGSEAVDLIYEGIEKGKDNDEILQDIARITEDNRTDEEK